MHPTWEATMADMWQYCTAHRPVPLPSSKVQKENNYWGLVRIYKPNQVSRTTPFTMLISVCHLNTFYMWESTIFHVFLSLSWLQVRQVNDNTWGISPKNTAGMIQHNNLSATAFKNTSTIHQQSKLSSQLSSTAWIYFGELYRLKNWVWICITRTALGLIQNVIGLVLPLGIHNPAAVPGRPRVSVRVKPTQ